MRSVVSAANITSFIATLALLLHYSTCTSAIPILHPQDFLALQAIRKSLHDLPGSQFFASWDFTSHPCNFPGVICDTDRVISLNLGDSTAGSPGLTGQIDPAIGYLSALAEFTVVPGRIIGTLPENLSQLKNLRFLGISRNFLSGRIPAAIGQLKRLQTLDLSFNRFTGSIAWEIGALPALSNVILCNNRLSGSVPPFVSQTLTRLELRHNNLSGSLPPNAFPSSLQYLSLPWNRLAGPVDRILTRLNRLNYLDLSSNQFTGSIPGIIFNFPITNLQLQRNKFSGPISPVRRVTIQTVDLSFNRFSGEISPFFSTVQSLYLNNNRFWGQVPGRLVKRLLSANIQILYLQHNYLTGMEIDPTAEIPISSSLCVQYNCMVPPVQTPCPLKAGKQKARPTEQCVEWKGRTGN
nr:LRR receptor-like serine/threonine-protein kinase ERL1 [Ipomoea batatas]